MDKLIRTTADADWSAPEHQQRLAYLLLCELLAYQFASCVPLSPRSLLRPSLRL